MKHIAILRKPYYEKIISGEKKIESRWTKNKCLPYMRLIKNDLIYLKEVGKPITAVALVEKVEYYELTKDLLIELYEKYAELIALNTAKEQFVLSHQDKKYCTLIWLKNVREISPLSVNKSYGAGWMIMEED